MKILSLFDGISCAQVALNRNGFNIEKYFASEINEEAIAITQKHFPNTVQLGNVKHIAEFGFYEVSGLSKNIEVDLLIGGSPCQDLSIAKRERKGLSGNRSGLFWDFLKILNELQPRYFILENVASMSRLERDTISNALSIEPVMIDAKYFSAQNRKRYFWTNIQGLFLPIEDRGLTIKDVVRGEKREVVEIGKPVIKTKYGVRWDTSGKGYFSQNDRAYSVNGKMPTIPTARTITKIKFLDEDGKIKNLTFEDIEEMQGLPRGYTAGIKSKEKRGGAIGNAFNVDVVAHILKFIPKNEK